MGSAPVLASVRTAGIQYSSLAYRTAIPPDMEPAAAVESMMDYWQSQEARYITYPLFAVQIHEERLRGTPKIEDAMAVFQVFSDMTKEELERLPVDDRLIVYQLVYVLVLVPAAYGLLLVEEAEKERSSSSAVMTRVWDTVVPLGAAAFAGGSIALGQWWHLFIELPAALLPLIARRVKLAGFLKMNRSGLHLTAAALHRRALLFFHQWRKTDFSSGLPEDFRTAAKNEIAGIAAAYKNARKIEFMPKTLKD